MTEERPKTGSYVHIELVANEPAKAKKFYEDVFGWTFQDFPEMDYTLFTAPSGPGGGIRKPGKDDPGGILNHLLVPSIDDWVKKIEKAGGKIVRPKAEIPGYGWWALFEDNVGNVQALWEQNPNEPR